MSDEPTAASLGAKATRRPWHSNGPEIRADADESGVSDVRSATDAAFIVYAANHIEQVEAELAEARALLASLKWYQRSFIRSRKARRSQSSAWAGRDTSHAEPDGAQK